MAVKINKWTPSRKSGGIPRVSARFSLSIEMGRPRRDGTVEPLLRGQILRRERGQGNIHSPYSADHEEDWQLQKERGASRRTSVSSPTKSPTSKPNARASKQPCARGGCCGRGRCSAWVTTGYPRGSCRESWRFESLHSDKCCYTVLSMGFPDFPLYPIFTRC